MPVAIKVGLVVLCVVAMITALGLLFSCTILLFHLAEFRRKRAAHHTEVLHHMEVLERIAARKGRDD